LPSLVHAGRNIRVRAWSFALRTLVFILSSIVLAHSPSAHAQAGISQNKIDRLLAAHQWDEVVRRIEPLKDRTPDLEYDYGSALAHLGRLDDAEKALRQGERLAPGDPRFPVERAGIVFQQKRYARAAQLLRHGLKLAPHDTYANDFLGTVYFLEGNREAALKYWNRVGKPRIDAVREEPVPRVDPALLDHAFVFAPASTMTLAQLTNSETRLHALGIFPQYQLDLNALPGGNFDVLFRNHERNGVGDSKLEAAVLSLRELPFQGVTPEYDNIARQAINFSSLFRWDAQKRRASAELSSPFEHSAKYRYAIQLDLRNENWVLRNSFEGSAPVLASLDLRREAGTVDLASHATDRLQWRAGAELSSRDYRSVQPGTALTPDLLRSGFQLKQIAEVRSTLLRIPERRFTLDAFASSQAARLWSSPGESSEKLQGALDWHWFPRAQGDAYAMSELVRAGKTFGQVPFDELFELGLERDNDLPMHAHIGTRDGRKGSAPLGRDYFLHSWQVDKNIYSNGLLSIKLGPVFDIGKIGDSGTELGSHKWLFDLGAQVKVRVLSTTVAFSYGHDIRAGHNAFYVAPLP
jgi:tetratricopeptide (TPR) repeat protein